MDRNQVIGIVLISVMLMVYMMMQPDKKPKTDPQNTQQSDSTATDSDLTQTSEDSTATLSDSTKEQSEALLEDSATLSQKEAAALAIKQDKFGIFAPFAQDTGKSIILENEDVKIVFNTKGANPVNVTLKKYTYWTGTDSSVINLMDEKSNKFIHKIQTEAGKKIQLEDLNFEVEGKGGFVEKKSSKTVKFKLPVGAGKFVEKSFTLKGSGYQLDYNLNIKGLKNELKSQPIQLVWEGNLKRTELGAQETQRSWMNYYTNEGEFDDILNESVELNNVKWISYRQRFFNQGFIAENSFNVKDQKFRSFQPVDSVQHIIGIRSTIELPFNHITSGKGNFQFYFGPNDYQICSAVTEKYKENVYMGWGLFGFISEWFVRPIFNFFNSIGIANYGIVILFTVILIKMLLFPIAFRSYKAMAKMKVLKPWIEEIKNKHQGNKQVIQMEQMKLYRQVGANPVSGCIPQLLQIPIFLSLFNFFPNWIPLRHESFLWAHDLSTYDAPFAWEASLPVIGNHISLFTLLMTLSTLAYTYYNNQVNTTSGPMKNIGYIMPIMFFFVLNSFAAALTYYYFLNTTITIIQQNLAMRFIDKDKIKAVMEENRKTAQASGDGGGKKSKFMQRLEEAQKVAEERRKAKKKK